MTQTLCLRITLVKWISRTVPMILMIWLERNVWAGNKDGIRHCQQFVINYEDSIRRRYQMEQEAAMRDSIGQMMIQQSKDIRRKLK